MQEIKEDWKNEKKIQETTERNKAGAIYHSP